MDSSAFVALFLARTDDTATSALPHAPKALRAIKPAFTLWSVLRGRAANFLHRLAWAIEPDSRRPY